MNNARPPIWWIPLARRVLGWGLIASVLSGVLPFILIMGFFAVFDFGMPVSGPNPPPEFVANPWEEISSFVVVSLLASSPFLLAGLMFGSTVGFYAPATEPKNPLKSRFFRGVASQTLTVWALASSALSLTFYYGFPYFGLKTPIYAVLGLSIVIFALSLWRAINRALHATKLK